MPGLALPAPRRLALAPWGPPVAPRTVDGTSLLIGGRETTDTDLRAGSLRCDLLLNARGKLSCQLVDPPVVPALEMDVLFTLAGTPVFGGIVVELTQTDAAAWSLTASDNQAILDGLLLNAVSPAGTLKSVLTWFVGLMGYGFSVSSAQADGPDLAAMAWPFQSGVAALDQLATLTGWSWTVSPTRVIRMYAGGAVLAPWPITIDEAETLTIRQTREQHATHVWVRFGSGAGSDVVWSTVGDGTALTFSPPYYVTTPPSAVVINGVTLPVAGYPPDTGWTGWTWEATPGQGILHAPVGSAPLTASDTLSVGFVAAWPSVAVAVGSGYALYTGVVIDYPDVFDAAVAHDLAVGEQAKRQGYPRTMQLRTARVGLQPGQRAAIVVPHLDVDTHVLVTGVRLGHAATLYTTGDIWWTFTVDLIEANATRTNWLTYWQQRKGGTAGGGTGSSVTGTIPPTGGGGADEVAIGPDDPGGAIELWYDTDATSSGGGGTGGIPAFLGGSRTIARTGPGPIAEWVGVILDSAKLPTGMLNVYGELAILSGGGTCAGVLMALNATTSTWHEVGRATAAGTGFFEFTVAAEPGRIAYRLEVDPSVATATVVCVGSVIGL